MQIGEKAAWQSGLIQLSSCEGIVCVCGIGAAASGRLSARQARDHLIERKHTRAVCLAGWLAYLQVHQFCYLFGLRSGRLALNSPLDTEACAAAS